jgi:hypothetical protein
MIRTRTDANWASWVVSVALGLALLLSGLPSQSWSQQRALLDKRRNTTMVQHAPAQRMEQVVRTFIQACNDANAEAIAASFCLEAVQYASGIKWSGAATIGSNFAKIVREQGYFWTVTKCPLMSTDTRRH